MRYLPLAIRRGRCVAAHWFVVCRALRQGRYEHAGSSCGNAVGAWHTCHDAPFITVRVLLKTDSLCRGIAFTSSRWSVDRGGRVWTRHGRW